MIGRQKIPIAKQVRIFYRDGWLCHWCGRPTIFPLALKYLQKNVHDHGVGARLAYYDLRYRRDLAPLLDDLAAVIDHVHAHSRGGADTEDNLVTACNKCNMRKSSHKIQDFQSRNAPGHVRTKFGEPKTWDGLVSVFMVLAESYRDTLTSNELEWHMALKEYSLRGTGPTSAVA